MIPKYITHVIIVSELTLFNQYREIYNEILRLMKSGEVIFYANREIQSIVTYNNFDKLMSDSCEMFIYKKSGDGFIYNPSKGWFVKIDGEVFCHHFKCKSPILAATWNELCEYYNNIYNSMIANDFKYLASYDVLHQNIIMEDKWVSVKITPFENMRLPITELNILKLKPNEFNKYKRSRLLCFINANGDVIVFAVFGNQTLDKFKFIFNDWQILNTPIGVKFV